jgi:hypothetical protein
MKNDKYLPNNKADIIILDTEKEAFLLIDIAICGDINVTKKEAKNVLKCKDRKTEIQCMWNVKSDASNNKGNSNHLRVIQKMSEKHTWQSRH